MGGIFMEAVGAYLAFGSVWSIILTTLWIIILFYWVEKEFIVWSGINILLYILFLNFTIKNNIFDGVVSHPVRTLIFILVYIIIGFLWSFVKWWLFVNKKAIAYKEKRCAWLLSRKEDLGKRYSDAGGPPEITLDTNVPYNMQDDWLRHYGYGNREIPKAIQHKKTISHWVLYWPISAIWSLIDDFVGKVLRIIIVRFRIIYEAITKNAFRGIEEIK
jgi:hypothetical protein